MKRIDLMQVCKNVLKRFWLPVCLAVLGILGAFLTGEKLVKTEWNLNSRYAIRIGDADTFENYSYSQNLAESVYALLCTDKELQNLQPEIIQAGRHIELHLSGHEDALAWMDDLQKTFERKAEEYLLAESAGQGILEKEYDELEEDDKQSPTKKILVLGGMLGFCCGMVILLLKEYIDSPKFADEDGKGEKKDFESSKKR